MTNSRAKGRRGELEAARIAREAGWQARVTAPNQTQDGSAEFADVRLVNPHGVEFRAEVKNHASYPDTLWQLPTLARNLAEWLGNADVLLLKGARKGWLAVVRTQDFPELDIEDAGIIQLAELHVAAARYPLHIMKYADWLDIMSKEQG